MPGKDMTVHQVAVDALGLASASPHFHSQCRTREQLLKHCQITQQYVTLSTIYVHTALQHTHTDLLDLVRDYPGEPVPER